MTKTLPEGETKGKKSKVRDAEVDACCIESPVRQML